MLLTPFSRLFVDALDFVFPIACVGCGRYDRGWLCADCVAHITPSRPQCLRCGTLTVTGSTCYRCRPQTSLAGVIACVPYRDPVIQAAITQLKFHGVRALAEPLGDLLARRIVACGLAKHGTTLCPLPLHPRRERERGFNQAGVLAEMVGRRLHLPVMNLLVRARATSPQTSIHESARARAENVAGAFQTSSPLPVPRYQRVILIDDVLTTGATLTEAARVLVRAGIGDVWAAVVARGSTREPPRPRTP